MEFNWDEKVWYAVLVARIVESFSEGGRGEEGRAGLGGKRCCGRGVGRCGEEKRVGCWMSSGTAHS